MWCLYFIFAFCFSAVIIEAAPCDPIFDECSPDPVPDPVPDPIPCTDENIFDDCHDNPLPPETPPSTPGKCENENKIKNIVDIRSVNDKCKNRKCDYYEAAGYRCAPSWTCQNNTIITDGKGIINVRSDDFLCPKTAGTLDVSDGKCEQVDYVCCKHPNIKTEKCKPPTGPKYDECGRTSTRLKITGQNPKDRNAQPGEFPHMCAIYRFQGAKRTYIGGASLIARNKVLTVAHKFLVKVKKETTDLRDQISDFYIRCGEHSVKNEIELLEPQESQVLSIQIHPEYNERRLRNNLAILTTAEKFEYHDHIGPVCLPKPFENFDNQRLCWSSGWGPDDFTSPKTYGDFLKKVQMPIVPRSECQRRLKATDRFRNKSGFRVHNSWLCVGGEDGSDTCKGDGGSPHVCKNSEGQWVQVGAVSWGVGCGGEVPAVYSSVPDAMCWVDWVMSCESEDDVFAVVDLRSVVDSRNGLTQQDCGEWSRSNRELTDKCEVNYE